MQLHFSFVIPVYNRPQEIQELLESFVAMHTKVPYEIVIVEDGSTQTSQEICKKFEDRLQISYYFKENSGPGDSRNYGMQRAKGTYYIILDSDCILPAHYMDTVAAYLQQQYVDCYGGADAAHKSFTKLQKAINYTMTSILTTGGIRGNKKSVQKFEPRSFNMGISKEAFKKTGGFAKIHPGEDPDLSQRIIKAGLSTTFITNAYVYHKRRISWAKFYTQVKKFGMVRPILNSWHPHAAKITFWFPSLFVVYCVFSIITAIMGVPLFAIMLGSYIGILFMHASISNKSISIGFLSILAMFIQFFGYGLAFLKATFYIQLLKRIPEKQFPHLFFN